jgi:hypothetical protein
MISQVSLDQKAKSDKEDLQRTFEAGDPPSYSGKYVAPNGYAQNGSHVRRARKFKLRTRRHMNNKPIARFSRSQVRYCRKGVEVEFPSCEYKAGCWTTACGKKHFCG